MQITQLFFAIKNMAFKEIPHPTPTLSVFLYALSLPLIALSLLLYFLSLSSPPSFMIYKHWKHSFQQIKEAFSN